MVTIRFLYGRIPLATSTDGGSVDRILSDLLNDAVHVPGSKLTIYAGYLRSGSLSVTGWNHSKTIITDSYKLLVGGENWLSQDYLQANPVYDLSMKMHGRVASDAEGFVNALWNNLCEYYGASVDTA